MKCKNCQSELTRGKKGYICEECYSRYSFEDIESENTQDWVKEVLEGYPTMIAIPFREMLRADDPTANIKLLASKEKILSPITHEMFTLQELNDRIKDHSKLELNELYLQKKLLPGIYLKRRMAEAKIKNFFVSPFPVAFVAARGGAGKSNLLGKFAEETIESSPILLLKAGDLEEDSIEETLQKLLGLEKEFFKKTLPESFVLRIFLDGLNERKKADTYFLELLKFVKRHPKHFKVLVSYRQDIGGSLPEIPESIKIHEIFYPGGSESSEKKEGLEKISIELDALNKLELKELWELYTKDKKKYLPKFNLEDLKKQNRNFLEELKNPLTLKIFCSTFQGKSIPKSITRTTFWKQYLEKLEINLKGSKKILLELANYFQENRSHRANYDSLLYHPILGEEFRKTQIDSVWMGLYKEGILFRKKEESGFSIMISIEPLLDYLTGEVFINAKLDLNVIQDLLKGAEYNPISRGISNYLTHCIATKNFKLISDFIDSTEEIGIEIAGEAIAETFLYQETIEGNGKDLFDELLRNQTERDLEVILEVVSILDGNLKFGLTEEILRYFRKRCTERNWAYVDILNKLGNCLNLTNEERLEFLVEAETISKSLIYNPEKEGSMLSNLGVIYENIEEYDIALEYFKKSLKIRLSSHGENHPDVASCYNNLGIVYDSKEEYDKAIEYHEKSLKIRLSILEENHPNVAGSYNNIGNVYNSQQDSNRALEYYEKSLKIFLSNLGENHPDVASCYNNIGIVYDSKGEYGKALEYYEKSLKISISLFGENHPNILTVQSSLLSILENISVPEIHQNIHQFLEELYQPCHHFLEEIYEMSGDCFQDVYPEFALSYYNKALSIYQNDEIENASSIAIIFLKIGKTYQKNANNLSAIDMFIKAREIYINIYGENDSDVANCFKKLGIAYDSLNDTPNAIENLVKSLEIYFSLYGKRDSEVSEVCQLLADVYDKIGESTKAEEYRDRAEGENDEEIEERERSERLEKKKAETHRKQKEEEVVRDSFEKKDSEQNNIAEKEKQVSLGLDAGHLQFKLEKAERERQEVQSHKSQIIDKTEHNETPDIYTNTIGMEFVLIPSGEFMMGAVPQDKDADDEEKPQHKVRITKPFYMGKYPVTQGEWQKVMGYNPSELKEAGNRAPVENISIYDIQKFIFQLNDIDGKLYRLPTEGEWEYSARGGTNFIFSFGDDGISKMFKSKIDDYAWYDKISENSTHPVGQKKPNDFELYDMIGNVLEWCEDSTYRYSSTESIDPIGSYSSYQPKILRGGSFLNNAKSCRVSKRFEEFSDKKKKNIGFRLVLVLNPSREQIEQMKLLFKEQDRLENRKKEIEQNELLEAEKAKWSNINKYSTESRRKNENVSKDYNEKTENNKHESGKNPSKKGLTSKAKITTVYNVRQIGLIAGCSVLFGSGTIDARVKLVRRKSIYWEGWMESIQISRQDVTSFNKGDECGIYFKDSPDFQEGDLIEFWEAGPR